VTKADTNRVLKLIKNMLFSRRNGNIALEQKYYEEIETLCSRFNANFERTMEQGIAKVRTTVSGIMNSL
jgi:hypothetical protein